MKWFETLLDRICALSGALIFAQFPQFFLQYLHELSGHVAELSHQVQLFDQTAKLSHKTLPELILKFLQNSDLDIVRQGELIQGMVTRLETFRIAKSSLEQASLITKPFVFLRYINQQIAVDTWKQFQLGFSFTLEGLVYAFIGMLIGYGLFQSLKFLLRISKPSTLGVPGRNA
jgi:hypothetical protein